MVRKRSCSTCSPLKGDDTRWYLDRCGSCLILGIESHWGVRPLRGFQIRSFATTTGPVSTLLASTTCVPSRETLAVPRVGGWNVRARHDCTDGPGRAAGIFVLGGLPPAAEPRQVKSHPPSAPSPPAKTRWGRRALDVR